MTQENIEIIKRMLEKGFKIEGFDSNYRDEGGFYGFGESLKITGITIPYDKNLAKRLNRIDVIKSQRTYIVPLYALNNFIEITGVL